MCKNVPSTSKTSIFWASMYSYSYCVQLQPYFNLILSSSIGRNDSKKQGGTGKVSFNRFSVFVKSGGENYILGKVNANIQGRYSVLSWDSLHPRDISQQGCLNRVLALRLKLCSVARSKKNPDSWSRVNILLDFVKLRSKIAKQYWVDEYQN